MANKNVTIKKRNVSNTGWDELYPVTTAENVKFEDGSSVSAQLADIANKQGNLTTLQTTEKTNLVGALNEVFQDADNGKTAIYNAIIGKGTTPSSQNFDDLVSAINKISTGMKIAKGTTAFVGNRDDIRIDLDFKPEYVIYSIFGKVNSSGYASGILIASRLNEFYNYTGSTTAQMVNDSYTTKTYNATNSAYQSTGKLNLNEYTGNYFDIKFISTANPYTGVPTQVKWIALGME